MKKRLTVRACGALILSAGIFLASVASSQATNPQPDLTYTVTLNVSSLTSDLNGPFSLALQLTAGSQNVTNTVTLTNFVFTGGAASATPNFTMGGETGSVTGTVTLTNSNPIDNELDQAFSAGVTQISFNVDQTVNPETGSSPAFDQFNVLISDNNANFVPTNDPTGNNTLISSTITEGEVSGDVQKFALAVVPEPGSAAMLLIGAVGLVWRRNRRATVQSA